MKTRSLWYGFLIGSISAGIATLLAAPSSGRETRQYLKENKEDIMKQLLEIKINLNELKNSISVLSKEGKVGITAFIQDSKTLIESWQSDIKPNQEKLKNELQSIKETIQELETSIQSPRK